MLRARLWGWLCLPHAPSPARPPPSTSPSSQWWAPSWRGPRRWGRLPGSRRRSWARCGTGSAVVAGGVCTPGEARAAGFAPCLVHARADRERLGGRLLVVRLGRGDSLLVERRSDGSAAVSFADGGGAGASVGVGLQLPGGPGVKLRGGGGVQFGSGRTWEFASFDAAARFVRRWASHRDPARRAARAAPGRRPPAAARQHVQGGRRVRRVRRRRCAAGRRAPSARARPGVVLGRRVGRDGRVTWYDRIDAETAGAARARARRAARRTRRARWRSRRPRPTAAPSSCALRGAARVHWDAELGGPVGTVADLAAKLRGAPREPGEPGGLGGRVEASVSLDLTDPANRSGRRRRDGRACALRVPPADWDDRVRALAARLDAAGEVDVRVLRVGLERKDVGAEVALGLGAGAAYERTDRGARARAGVVAAARAGRCRSARTACPRNRSSQRAYL